MASDARRVISQETARRLIIVLDEFRAAHHRLPNAAEGLSLLSPEHVEVVPLDAWHRPFLYAPSADNLWADVVSYGSDGKPGGDGNAADISGRFGSLALRPPGFIDVLAQLLFFALVLVGLIGAARLAWAAGMLAGNAAVCGLLLLTVITADCQFSSLVIVAPVVTMACLTSSVAVLRRAPGAPVFASAAVLSAYLLLGKLMAG